MPSTSRNDVAPEPFNDLSSSIVVTALAVSELGKAEASVTTSESRRAFAEWLAARALEPGRFPNRVFAQLHLPVEVQTGQDGSSLQDNF